MKESSNYADKIAYSIIFLAVLIIGVLSFFFLSCTTTKKVDKQTENITEVKTVNIDSIVKLKVDSTARHWMEFVRTLDADIIFNDCDTVFTPGKERVVNTIKYVPGKGFEAVGVKQFKLKESELIKTIDELTLDREHEVNLRIAAEDSLKYYHSMKTTDKKKKSIWWIWFGLGGLTVFALYNRKKIVSLFKKVV
jgi:heme/copper-type cytochrome/quinol oxidase subunit 2